MSVHKKIDSFERNTLSGSETSKIVFFSTVGKDEITDFINNSFPVGEETQEHGLVESARFFQESSFWCCEVNFSRSYSSGGVSIEMQGRDDGPVNHSLATVNIPLDISCAKSYRTGWNHFLFACLRCFIQLTEMVNKPILPHILTTSKLEVGCLRPISFLLRRYWPPPRSPHSRPASHTRQ